MNGNGRRLKLGLIIVGGIAIIFIVAPTFFSKQVIGSLPALAVIVTTICIGFVAFYKPRPRR